MGASVTQGTRIRVDALLVKRGLVDSRTQAAAAVLAGEVYVSGTRAAKPGQLVTMDALVEVRSRRRRFVGRGGGKNDPPPRLFPNRGGGQDPGGRGGVAHGVLSAR